MNITHAIQELYPGLEPGRDFVVRDDGKGPYLAEWNNPNPRPDDAQLAAAWRRVVARRGTEALREKEDGTIGAKYGRPDWVKDALLDLAATLPTTQQKTRLTEAGQVRVKRNAGEERIRTLLSTGATAEQIQAEAERIKAEQWGAP